jgi:hypothetical protein
LNHCQKKAQLLEQSIRMFINAPPPFYQNGEILQ